MASSSSTAPKLNSGLVLDAEALRRRNNAEINTILEKLEKTGLLPLLTAHTERYFEEDVADFYANATTDQKNFTIKSTVNGQAVEVTPAILCDCFNLPVHGVEDVKGYGGTEDLSVWYDITGTTTGMSFPFKKDLLKPQFRVLADIVGKILECRAGSHDRVTKLRFKLMSLILVEEKVNWSLVIFNFLCEEMRFRKRIFGILLGYVLTKMQLNLRPGRAIHKNKFLFHGDLGTKKGAKSQASGESGVRVTTAPSPTTRAGDEAESTPQTGPAPAAPTDATQAAQFEALMARLAQGTAPAHPREQPSASSTVPCAKGSSSKAPQPSRTTQTQGEESDAGSSYSEVPGIDEELLQKLEEEGSASDLNWSLIEGQEGHFYVLLFHSGTASAHKLIGRKILKTMNELLQHPFAREGQSYTTWRRLRMALPYNASTSRLWNFCRTMEPNIREWTGIPSIYENLRTDVLPRTILEKRCGIIRDQVAAIKSECSGTPWCRTICNSVEAIFNRYMVYLRAEIIEVEEEEDSLLAREFVPIPAPPIRIPEVEVPLTPPVSLIADSELEGEVTPEVPDPYKQAQQGAPQIEEDAEEDDDAPLIRKRRRDAGEGTSSSMQAVDPSSTTPDATESFPHLLHQGDQPLSTIPEEEPQNPAEPMVEQAADQSDMIEAMLMLHELTEEEEEAPREEVSPELQAQITQLEAATLEDDPESAPPVEPVTIPEAPTTQDDPEPIIGDIPPIAPTVDTTTSQGEPMITLPTPAADKGKGVSTEDASIIPYHRAASADDRVPVEVLQSLLQNMERLQREYAHIAEEQRESHRGIFEYMYKTQDELQKVLKFESSLKQDAADAMASMRNGLETRLLRIENTVANQVPDYFNQRISTLSGQVDRLDSSFLSTRTSIMQALTSQDARLRLIEADIQEVRTLVRMLLSDDKKGEEKGKGKEKGKEKGSPPPDPSRERKRKFMGDAFPSSRKR